LKGYGYLVSIVSVFLLAVPGLKSAQENGLMAICLGLGMATSIAGMGLRFLAHRKQQAEMRKVRQEAGKASRGETARAA
jgi:hypothetical protein